MKLLLNYFNDYFNIGKLKEAEFYLLQALQF